MNAPIATDALKRRTRLFMIGALVVAGAAFAVIAASGINKNIVYYWTPSDIQKAGDQAYGATIRLGGMVVPGSVHTQQGSNLEFDVKDATRIVHVKSSGAPPQMFRENIGVVVEGTMVPGGYFKSDRLLVSHSNEYRAPKKGHPIDRKEIERLMKSTEGLKD
jgi:cytochrome c-type biogenesis protein CcmE